MGVLFDKWKDSVITVYDSQELSTLELLEDITDFNEEISKGIDNTNEKIDRELAEKTNVNGDHKGTWQGLNRPTLSEEGMRATVEKNIEEIEVINNSLQNIDTKIYEVNAQLEQKAQKDDVDNSLKLKADKTTVVNIQEQLNSVASGSPKGTFATLIELQNNSIANTTEGKKNIYVVTADGGWYYWSGNAWIKGGIYQSSGIEEKSISYDKTDFISPYKNLADISKFSMGSFLSEDGTLGSSTGGIVSPFIYIKPNTSYVYSDKQGFLMVRVISYDANKNPIDGSLADNVRAYVTPSNAVFVRFRPVNDSVDIQFEEGTVPTQYEPFNHTIKKLKVEDENIVQVNGEKIEDLSISIDKINYYREGKNMFNKYTSRDNVLLSGGVESALANYFTSSYIKVKAGTKISYQKCRVIEKYDTRKRYLSVFNTNNNDAIGTIDIETDGFIRISGSISNKELVQVELGNLPTQYEPFGKFNDFLLLSDEQKNSVKSVLKEEYPIVVTKSGNSIVISSNLENELIEITTSKNGSNNGTFNFINTKINGTVIHENTDDITPIRTFSTIGANHGYTNIVRITMLSHGKTTLDLGSKWSDGVTEYTLLDIIGNDLVLGCPYTVSNGIVSSVTTNPVGNLNHVSGATNKTTINVSTLVSGSQLRPCVNNISTKLVLDGKEIINDGEYYGNEFQIQESYNIMDYKAIIDYAQSNIGKSYKNEDIQGVVKISVNYSFTNNCKCLVSYSIRALNKVTLNACGFIQSAPINVSGMTLKRYLNGVKAKSGYDFSKIVDMTSYNANLNFTSSDFINTNKPPNRVVDWLFDGVNKKYGYTVGYIVDKTNSSDAKRMAQIGNNIFWDMRSTKKIYPNALMGLNLNAGDYYTFECYRNYLSPNKVNEATNINIIEDKKDVYVYIDYHKIINGKNIKLDNYIGKSITILDSQNFSLLNDIVDTEGITFNITNDYGYAVLKLN